MRIIPAIDIIDGKCVRLSRGDYATKKVYNEDPLEVAKMFEGIGIRYLHLVDLDGARSRHIVNHAILERIATRTSLSVDFGGGLKTDQDLRIAFESGAQQVTGGSVAVSAPETFAGWLLAYGPDRIILGADAREEKIAISGWQEESSLELLPFITGYREKGVKYAICTDISRDGMLDGPAFDLYRRILERVPGLQLIASGGISNISELPELAEIGCEGTIIGKAIYENRISLKELERFLLQMNRAKE